MNKEEFKLSFKKLIEKRKLDLKDINKYVADKIDSLSLTAEEKENLTKDLKAKAIEFFKTENDNLKAIKKEHIKKLNELAATDEISEEDYEALVTAICIDTLNALEENQNQMLELRVEYADFNFLVRGNFHNSISGNSNATEEIQAVEPQVVGSTHKMFDHSSDGGGGSSSI